MGGICLKLWLTDLSVKLQTFNLSGKQLYIALVKINFKKAFSVHVTLKHLLIDWMKYEVSVVNRLKHANKRVAPLLTFRYV